MDKTNLISSVGNIPLICGGYGNDSAGANEFASLEQCVAYDFGTNTWAETGRIPQGRDYMGYDYHPAWGLVMAGEGLQ